MTDLFLDILNTSLSATWVVLAVVLARLLLKKVPRGLVCGLWALVGLRLLIGDRLEAPLSMIPSAEIIPPQSLLDPAPVIESGVPIIDRVVNPVYTESLRPIAGASVNPLQVWMAVFANIWLLGLVTMALWALWSAWRVRRQVGESLHIGGNVYLCDRVESPFIFGFLRPKIYLPSDLDDAAKAHVIAHENAHIARRDHWWKPLAFILLTVNWFNPAMWLAYILLCRDIEMACDERVVEGLTLSDKKAYSSALLRCSVRARYVTACPLAFGEVGVKERVKSVLNYRKPAFWIIAVTLIVALVLGVGLLTSPESEKSQLNWDGLHYTQEGRAVRTLPEDAVEAGTLLGLTEHSIVPNSHGHAVNLPQTYVGLRIYLLDDMLYLREPGGGTWLPFRQAHGLDDLNELLKGNVQCELTLRSGKRSIMEYLSKSDIRMIRELLYETEIEFQPYPEWTQILAVNGDYGDIMFQFNALSFDRQANLIREDEYWILVYQDQHFAYSAWRFESGELDAYLASWEQELAAAGDRFHRGEEDVLNLEYVDMELEDITMRCAIPKNVYVNGDDSCDWEYQGHASHTDKTVTLSLRPFGCGDWMDITFFSTEDITYYADYKYESITLPNGASGILCHRGNPALWQMLVLDTTSGQLRITSPAMEHEWDWADEDFQTALSILSTLTITENGTSLLGQPNRLGLSLSVSDVTPHGLTLHCAQDGTSVAEVWTGSQWWVEQLTDGKWVHVFPGGETAWTTEAYPIPIGETRDFHVNWTYFVPSLEPGTYRIAKHFLAELTPVTVLSPDPETVSQIYYAEFTIE